MAGGEGSTGPGSEAMDMTPQDRPSATGFSLDPETFKKIHPMEYHRRFLSQGVRADGRVLTKFRKAKISLGSISTANGSAMVRLGDTTVICGVKAEVTEPKPAAPKSGFIVPNLDLPPLCSPNYRAGPPPELAQTVSEYIDQVIKSCDLVDPETLCIEPGHAVWVLYVDVICLNHGGNVMDAALIALVAALKHTLLPKATFYESESTVRVTEERTVPLMVKQTLIPVTFGVFDGTITLADPTSDEEPHLSTQLTLILDGIGGNDAYGMLKPGGTVINRSALLDMWELAKIRAINVSEALEEAFNAANAI
ncbi:hypothetical protein PhCBS80983_g04905 [Powellomyces hirtus]|uniref:Ribosomal RNA-processing protein 43 n=1 Tax=Powellomyces hirtus TaxID=109895 RepID=A0A507DXP5_9FUNG|nr:hypothetical protein PhCBS80983_g04905 [Powellomyces hirtus]